MVYSVSLAPSPTGGFVLFIKWLVCVEVWWNKFNLIISYDDLTFLLLVDLKTGFFFSKTLLFFVDDFNWTTWKRVVFIRKTCGFWGLLMCHYFQVEKDLVNNGLYGQYFIHMAFMVWSHCDQHPWISLFCLIPMNFMVALVFTMFVETLVKRLGITPGFTPGYIVAALFLVSCSVPYLCLWLSETT